jgi:hypothetical protein
VGLLLLTNTCPAPLTVAGELIVRPALLKRVAGVRKLAQLGVTVTLEPRGTVPTQLKVTVGVLGLAVLAIPSMQDSCAADTAGGGGGGGGDRRSQHMQWKAAIGCESTAQLEHASCRPPQLLNNHSRCLSRTYCYVYQLKRQHQAPSCRLWEDMQNYAYKLALHSLLPVDMTCICSAAISALACGKSCMCKTHIDRFIHSQLNCTVASKLNSECLVSPAERVLHQQGRPAANIPTEPNGVSYLLAERRRAPL